MTEFPVFVRCYWIVSRRMWTFKPDQMTVNEYKPGQAVTMEFRHPDGLHVPVVLRGEFACNGQEKVDIFGSHG
ncbi:Alkylated DNA repair protein alkB 8 [Desmophyllum pertusum]|uniref:Alkylated DNA repair protein alkB 8 n=1 Tax=Desmophyllum pertusum TaxID=174260 RepID=A0A9W9ZL83_9CNID|nr:Alkylated DNA repair protein alkB 8 [Desmophyllum pertusum]